MRLTSLSELLVEIGRARTSLCNLSIWEAERLDSNLAWVKY